MPLCWIISPALRSSSCHEHLLGFGWGTLVNLPMDEERGGLAWPA
jgi:hypothetical protein